jgi:prevent-host-death family protein
MPTSLTGIVRGNAIEFEGDIGLPDGQVVSVILRPVERRLAAGDEHLATEFGRLAGEWKDATGHLSSISQKTRHPAYQAIIAMGERAIPLILQELEREPNDWFPALEKITGEDPVAEPSYGIVDEMAKLWLEWGKSHGYEWSFTNQKIAPLADVKARLSAYVDECGVDGPIVITRNGKPAAVLLVPRDEEDLERLLLGRSPQFQTLLSRSRQSIKQGRGLSEKDFWNAVRERAKQRKAAVKRRRTTG